MHDRRFGTSRYWSRLDSVVLFRFLSRDVLALPFGTGRTSPIAAEDVARVVAAQIVASAQLSARVPGGLPTRRAD